MRLVDLDPAFERWETKWEGSPDIKPAGGEWGDPYWRTTIHRVPTLAEAQSLSLLCPACYAKNNGSVGTHRVLVGFEGRGLTETQGSRNKEGKPSRWAVSGTHFDDLTCSPSIDCGCWHGFIRNGETSNA